MASFQQRAVVDESSKLYAAGQVRRQYDNQAVSEMKSESNRQIRILQNNATALTNEEEAFLQQHQKTWEAVSNLIMNEGVDIAKDTIEYLKGKRDLEYQDKVGETNPEDKNPKPKPKPPTRRPQPPGKEQPPSRSPLGPRTNLSPDADPWEGWDHGMGPMTQEDLIWWPADIPKPNVPSTERTSGSPRHRPGGDLSPYKKDGTLKNPKKKEKPKNRELPGPYIPDPNPDPDKEPEPKPKPKPKPGDEKTDETEKSPPPPEPRRQLQSFSSNVVYGAANIPVNAAGANEFVETSNAVDTGFGTQAMNTGGADFVIDGQPATATQKQIMRSRYRDSSPISMNTALQEANTFATSAVNELQSRNNIIHHVQFNDGTVRSFTLAEALQKAEAEPEYFTHALGILAAEKRKNLYERGWSPAVIHSKISPIHATQLGSLVNKFNTSWSITNANKNLDNARYKLMNAFLGNATPESKVAVMTGVLQSAMSNFRDLSLFPGQEKMYKKARLKWLGDRHKEIMELMELQNGSGEEVNKFFANYKVQTPAWMKGDGTGFTKLSEAHPEYFNENVLGEKLQKFQNNTIQQDRTSELLEAKETVDQILEDEANSKLEKDDPNYYAKNDIVERKQEARALYTHIAPEYIKRLDDRPYVAKGPDQSYQEMVTLKNSRDVDGDGGYITLQEIQDKFWHPAAVKKFKEKFGKTAIEEDIWEKDIAEGDLKKLLGPALQVVKDNSGFAKKADRSTGAWESRALEEMERETLMLARGLFITAQDSDAPISKEVAIKNAATIMARKAQLDDKLATAENPVEYADGSARTKGYGKYGAGTEDGFQWFKDRGSAEAQLLVDIADAKAKADRFWNNNSNLANPFTDKKYESLANINAFQNNSRGELQSIWYTLAEIAKKNGINISPLELARAQAKLHNVEFEEPIDWDSAEQLHTKLKNNNQSFDPSNVNQTDRALTNIKEISPRVFRRSIGEYNLPWDQVPALANAIGETVPATQAELLRNPVLRGRLFDQYMNQNLPIIMAQNPRSFNQVIRMLAASAYMDPNQLMVIQADGQPAWRSSVNGMDVRTQRALDLYRHGGLIIEF